MNFIFEYLILNNLVNFTSEKMKCLLTKAKVKLEICLVKVECTSTKKFKQLCDLPALNLNDIKIHFYVNVYQTCKHLT